jgi:UDP-N-acetyl-D-glucosamine dehydrogenase
MPAPPDAEPPSTQDIDKPSIAVLGLGYVGLPTSLAYCGAGHHVLGIDINAERLDAIRAGSVDALPSDLEALTRALPDGQLELTTDVGRVSEVDAVLICVPTPVDQHLGPLLDPLRAACSDVAARCRPGQLLVLTSTTYVGTTRDLLVEPLSSRGLDVGADVFVAFAPERIDPGNASFPPSTVPRVVGGVTEECTRRAAELTSAISPVHVVSSPETAELTKLYENAFRAVNISLANELSEICDTLEVPVTDVIDAAATKPYGFMRFKPGPGVGGHCIPVDPHYLLWQLRAHRRRAPMIEAAMAAVAERPVRVAEQIVKHLSDDGVAVRGAKILVVGAAYKPGVADVRSSPAIDIMDLLRQRGAEVSCYDPLVAAVTLGDGSLLMTDSVPPAPEDYDLAVVHVRHPGVGYSWLDRAPRLADFTYSSPRAASGARALATTD